MDGQTENITLTVTAVASEEKGCLNWTCDVGFLLLTYTFFFLLELRMLDDYQIIREIHALQFQALHPKKSLTVIIT